MANMLNKRVVSLFLVAFLSTLGLASCSRVKQDAKLRFDPPEWCRSLDCPRFDSLEVIGDIEHRRYEAARWITTNITNKPWSEAVTAGYRQLDDYRGGNNKDQTKIAETVPYFTLFYPVPGADHQVQSFYTVEYFLPYAVQDSPPAPVTDALQWVDIPVQEVWVQAWGGFPQEPEIINKAWNLQAQLAQQGKPITFEFFGFAQYNSIVSLVNRHNEIWIFGQTQPSV